MFPIKVITGLRFLAQDRSGTCGKTKGNDEIHVLQTDKTSQKSYSLQEKCVFICSCVVIILITSSLLNFQWLTPFIYLALWPVLMPIRIITWWKRKWMFFLADFCYVVNILTIVILCKPSSPYLFNLVWIFSNGPILWATQMFRDAIVLHRIHRLSSAFFHCFPALISFCIRWYPDKHWQYWFRIISPEIPPEFSFLWSWIIPLTLFIVYYGFVLTPAVCLCQDLTGSSHKQKNTINFVLVECLIKPSEEYMTLFDCLNGGGFTKKALNTNSKRIKFYLENGEDPDQLCGSELKLHLRLYMLILFSSFCCYGGLTMVGSVIVFYSFEAHCFLILLVLLLTIRNTVFAYRDETSSKN